MTAAFTNFTSNGSNTTTASQFNVSDSFNQGWNFYTLGWKTGNTIFFSVLGFRDTYSGRSTGNGSIMNVGISSSYWSDGASSEIFGRFLSLSSGGIYPQNATYRSMGYTCRVVSDF